MQRTDRESIKEEDKLITARINGRAKKEDKLVAACINGCAGVTLYPAMVGRDRCVYQ